MSSSSSPLTSILTILQPPWYSNRDQTDRPLFHYYCRPNQLEVEEIDIEGKVGEVNGALGELDVKLVEIDVTEAEVTMPPRGSCTRLIA